MRFIIASLAAFAGAAWHVDTAWTQSDSAFARASHDSAALAPVLAELDAQERIRVEVPRNLLDLQNPHVLTPRERVVLYQPLFEDNAIRYSRAQLPKWAEAATQSFPAPLPLSQVFRVEARRDNTAGGALIGALVVGGVTLAISSERSCEDATLSSCPETGESIAPALIGAALGALAGAFIGRRMDRWKTVYKVGSAQTAQR